MRKTKLILAIVITIVVASSCAKKKPIDKIVAIEKAFMDLRAELQKACTGSLKDYQDYVMAPFAYVGENSAYAGRDASLANVAAGQALDAVFRYQFEELSSPKARILASFQPGPRIMTLDAGFDEDKLFNLLILGHEAIHCMIDDQMRSQLSLETYTQIVGFIDLQSEMNAYQWEIEAINLLTKGQFKSVLESGKSYDIEKLAAYLGLSKNDPGYSALGSITNLAACYYTQELDGYKDCVAELVRKYAGPPYVKVGNEYAPYYLNDKLSFPTFKL